MAHRNSRLLVSLVLCALVLSLPVRPSIRLISMQLVFLAVVTVIVAVTVFAH